MQDIELQALQNYQNNLDFFSKNNQDVFKKLQLFDMAEAEGKLLAKYDLEYKENYFDVKSIEEDQYLYGVDSLKYSQNVAKSINYDKNSSLYNGLIDYIATQEQIEELHKKKELKGSNIKDILPIMNYTMKVAPQNTTMKKIDKFIFIGTALGLHIDTIDKIIHSSEYLIVEDNLELFRLSLFTMEYYKLAEHTNLHFAIAQNETDFSFTMARFLEGSFFNNRYIKYFHFPAHSNIKLKLIQNNIASQNHLTFPYDIVQQKFLRPLKRVREGYKTLNLNERFSDLTFTNQPTLILAAGPSFKKNLSWVKENQHKYIIVAVTAVLKTLHEHQITPDIVTHIDGIESEGNSCMIHFEGFNATDFLKDSMFIFGTHSPDSLLGMFNKKNIFFFETSTFYFNQFGSLSTPCIGSTSVILSLYFNAKEIYLLGLDLALDQETGATHSGDHEYNATHNIQDSEEINYTTSLRNNLIPIKGNFRETVLTTPLFHISVRSLFGNIQNIKDSTQTIFNLNDGAFIQNTIPTHIQTVDSSQYNEFDKITFAKEIYTLLTKKSRDYFNEDELNSLHKRLQNAQNIFQELKEYENKNYSTTDQYIYDLLGIVSSILKYNGREGDNLATIYSAYFQYVLPYIMDIVNTKEVVKVMKHLKKIDKMFIQGCFNIIEIYIKELEKNFVNTKKPRT